MGVRQLRALWEGGVRDWVGSGLARYSVDEKWRIPHFEKMLLVLKKRSNQGITLADRLN
jgi:uncharacterized protein YyaL (SSP411 family)